LDEAIWDALARNLVRAELMKRGLSYARLVEALAAIGVEETEQSIKSKMSRGRFPFAFFLQVMVAIGGQWLEVPSLGDLRRGDGVGEGGAQWLARSRRGTPQGD
jgi:adenylate kinase family enzyme